MSEQKNVAIVGGGPGGYAAAFLAAELGMNVTLIDKEVNPGGVCLYRGCIPSKALLHIARLIRETGEAKNFGVDFGEPKIDLDKLRNWKEQVVKKLTGGTGQLSKQRKVNYIQGFASFVNSNTLSIKKEDGTQEEQSFDNIIVATGSVPAKIPNQLESERVINSSGALDLEDIPKKMLVIGGGYIGLEMATVYSAIGSKVSVVEMMPNLLPGADKDLVNILSRSIKSITENVMLKTKVVNMEDTGSSVKVTFEDENGKQSEDEFDKVLVSIGRKPVTDGFGLENTKVQIDDNGFIKTDDRKRTDDPTIFAIGDVAGNPMLAHKGSAEGRVAAEVIAGKKSAFEPNAIPAVVFTDPELAWAGLTETEAKEKGVKYEVAKFQWAASGRATTFGRNDGLTKLIIDPDTERILGVGIVGVNAGEMIAEGALAVEMSALVNDVALTIHAHPTLSETVMEAGEVYHGQATHLYRPKRK